MKNLKQLLANLINELTRKKFVCAALDINDILYEFMQKTNTEEEKDEQETSDSDIAANVVGLQEDGTIGNMNQGYSWEGFHSQYGRVE